jgi:hypothetical protein
MTDRRFILIDLDDTLCASWRREHLIDESWDAFHGDLVNDDPIVDIARALAELIGHRFVNMKERPEALQIIGLTARPEKWRTATVGWLARHEIDLDEILMRPDDDFRPSPIVKLALAAERFGGEEAIKDHVAFVIDDRPDVCQAFAGVGVTTLQVYARRG